MTKDLSEFKITPQIEGTVKLDEIKGQKVLITNIEFIEGEYGELALLDVVTDDDKHMTIRTSSTVLMKTLKQAAELADYPYSATFVKVKRYWTLKTDEQ
jgi:hypothetical protein